MTPLISVIVPVYNTEQYLPRCIESIINQKYKNLEIILIDDGSTDNSGDICEMYAKKDGRIRVVHQENGGLFSARVAGLNNCTSEYVGFVDSDDWINENMYEHMIEMMVKHNVDIVDVGILLEHKHNTKVWLVNDNKIYYRDKNNNECTYFHMFYTDEKNVSKIIPSVCNKLFKAKIIKNYYMVIPNVQFGEDSACVYACLPFIDSIYVSSRALYYYNQTNETSICQNKRTHTNYMTDVIKVHSHLSKIYQNHEAKENLIGQLDAYLLHLIFNVLPQSLYDRLTPYFFPTTKQLYSKDTIIYGAGEVGRSYCKQFMRYEDINIASVIDKKKAGQYLQNMLIEDIKNITTLKFDIIVIAIKDEQVAFNIKKDLIDNYGVDEQKILWKKPVYISEKVLNL